MKKHNLLFVISSLNGGGAERVLIKLLENLDEKKFNFFLAVNSFSGEYVQDIPKHVNIFKIEGAFYQKLLKLNRIIKKQKIDLAIGCMVSSNLLLLTVKFFLNKRLKIISTEHNNPSRNYIPSPIKVKSYLKKHFITFFYPYSDRIISVSNGIRNELFHNYKINLNKISTIHNPASIEDISIKKKETVKIFENNTDIKTIVAVGRLVPQKGYFDMLEIMSELKKRIKVRLIILGEGDQREALQDKIDELNLTDCVELIGFVDNPWAYISKSDVYLSTSYWEGFHMSIVEAMACGVFPIVSDCDYGPREIIVDNEMGALIQVGEINHFVDTLFEFLSKEDNSKSILKCIKRANDFDTPIIVQKYNQHITNVLNET